MRGAAAAAKCCAVFRILLGRKNRWIEGKPTIGIQMVGQRLDWAGLPFRTNKTEAILTNNNSVEENY